MNISVTVSPVDMEERANLGIKAGDTVRVWQKIQEKDKTRLQAFEGLVLARKHGNEAGGTFTVRKVASGVGVEKIFPLHSPMIDKIEIIKRAKVRRAKLYFIRDKVAREVKRLLRRTEQVSIATKGSTELEEERKRAEEAEQQRQEAEAKRAEEDQKKEESKEAEEPTEAPQDGQAAEEPTQEQEETEESATEGAEKSEDIIEEPTEEKQEDDKKRG